MFLPKNLPQYVYNYCEKFTDENELLEHLCSSKPEYLSFFEEAINGLGEPNTDLKKKCVKLIDTNASLPFPDEILLKILGNLDARDLHQTAVVSRRFNQFSNEARVEWINTNEGRIMDLGLSNTQLENFLKQYGHRLRVLQFERQDKQVVLEFLKHCPNLNHLMIKACKIKDTEVAAITNLINLTALNLSYNIIDASGAKALASGNLTNLRTLDLGFNAIGDAGANALAFGNLTNLTTLNLRKNEIKDAGAIALAFGNLTSLTTLNLCENEIEASGIKTLAFRNLTNLTTLDLKVTHQIGDAGVQSIKRNLKNLENFFY